MNKKLINFFSNIALISFFFGILNYFEIQTQWYVWEILVDFKIIALVILLTAYLRRNNLKLGFLLFVKKWSTLKNILFFFLPIIFAGIVVIIGIISKKIEFVTIDNTATLLLTTIFDIPSIFVFSSTTFLVEEIVFRGFLFDEIKKSSSVWYSSIISSLVWSIYSFSDVAQLFAKGEISILLVLFLYFFAIGYFSAAIYLYSKSIWCSYSFRIGVMTIVPLALTLLSNENDSFFVTENIFFNGDGIIFSSILIIFSIAFFAYFNYSSKHFPAQNKTA